MDSKIALLIQLNGVLLITVLSFFMRRALKLNALKYWTIAWLCLSFALICLRLAFSYDDFGTTLFTYYFLGEYLFGFLLVAGCRSLVNEYEMTLGTELSFVPFVFAAIALPLLASDFNDIFNIHSLIMSGFFFAAFRQIGTLRTRNFGSKVMYIALGLLAANFFFYFIVFSARHFVEFPTAFLAYNSIIDLVLETMLGFGMVIVLLEKVLQDVKTANESLQTAQHQLEILAQTDPLTAAFNRHAFYGFVKKTGEGQTVTSGCVGFFDIDNLKGINDAYGHVSGDMAIRAVVRAIRDLMRAEDLIYRWGGDEFFVIMVSMNARMAEERMRQIDRMLSSVEVEGLRDPINVGVSWGFMDFTDSTDLERAIQGADAAMYAMKQQRKQSEVPGGSLPTPAEYPSNLNV